MSKLLTALGQTAEGMEQEYGVNRRHIEKFRYDRWGGTSRRELQVLMSLARQCGFDFLTLETDEVWKTFGEGTAASFLSLARNTQGAPRGLRREDNEAMGFLLRGGIDLDHPGRGDDVLDKMRTRNCVIIGSPKYNEAADVALRALADNAERAGIPHIFPFKFVWNDWNTVGKESPFCRQSPATGEIGLEVAVDNLDKRPRKAKGMHTNLVSRDMERVVLKADLSSGTKNYGWDYGVLVMCRKPLGTDQNVTTVMFGGLSAFATQEIARELSHGLLFLHPRHIVDGGPLWRILCCPWRKKGRSVSAHSAGRQWIDPADTQLIRDLQEASRRPPPRRRAGDEDDDDDNYPR